MMQPNGSHESKLILDPSGKELAAVEHMVFGKRRILWIGLTVILIPLGVLLALQYSWLIDLQRNSVVARRETLDNYLKAVTNEARFFYTTTADRILTLPPIAYTEETIQDAVHYFGSRDRTGVRRLFIVTFQPVPRLFFYDEAARTMITPEDASPESRAVWVAVAPWTTLHKTLGEIRTTGLSVNEHDPERRMMLNPITDDAGFLFAIVGMIVDQDVFAELVIPEAVHQALPRFDTPDTLWVCVHDGSGDRVYPAKPCSSVETDRIRRNFDFIFTDWTLSLQGRLAVPERWARANFALNVTLSAALAVVLLGGIIYTARAALRELKLSAMKNEFVSNVSHELRTPLASIRVFGELMRHGRVHDATKVAEYGAHIEAESRRLTQLINNILDFSHIESGRKIYSFEPVDLERLLAGSLEVYQVRLRNNDLQLEYDGPDEPLPDLQIDGNAMDRAISNLLDNAVKYSTSGGRITVRLAREGDEAIVSVADEGIGIPADEQERVFDRFHRVSTGLVHDVKGTGLGLSLVRHIVHANGGRVTLESELGKGSTFTIHLPIGWQPRKTERGHRGQSTDR
jgi:signal transduction histidine kinase